MLNRLARRSPHHNSPTSLQPCTLTAPLPIRLFRPYSATATLYTLLEARRIMDKRKLVERAWLVAPLLLLTQSASLRAQASRPPTVIERATPQWTTTTALKVDPKPTITLGSAEPLFSSVSGAHRYADGRIVVADEKAKELLMFDGTGKFLRKIARPGSGPGEFQSLSQLFSAGGDSLAVWDERTRRVTYFGERGQFLRSSASATGTTTQRGKVTSTIYPSAIGRFADGSLLAQQIRGNSPQVSKKIVDSMTYSVLTDSEKKPIGDFFTKEHWVYFHSDESITFGDSPFSRVPSFAVGPQSFFISDGAQFEVTEHDKSGAPIRVMRIRRALSPVTAEQIAQFRNNFNESSNAKRNEAVLKWMTYPKTLPAFKQLIRDRDGNIWAGSDDGNPAKTRFDVFALSGSWLGTVLFPNNSTVLDVGKDWALLRVNSADGEPLVQLHRMVRGQ